MKSKFRIAHIVIFLLFSSPLFSQASRQVLGQIECQVDGPFNRLDERLVDCPQTIVKDTTTFVFKKWIRKEIPKDSLMHFAEIIYDDKWGIPSKLLQNNQTDTTLIKMYAESKTSFMEKMNQFLSSLKPEERVYLYSSSKFAWKNLRGEVGFVILRDCELVRMYVIARS
jgi:uncharacterized protein YozE (UPF0346 family)